MSSTTNNQSGDETPRFQVSPDTVYETLDDRSILINVTTNEIYELNQTGARFWELLSAGHDHAQIRQIMLQEYDVDEAVLDREIEALLASLKSASLIIYGD
jgi:Coenzyme PQQ synthesis protein D (PqqD)